MSGWGIIISYHLLITITISQKLSSRNIRQTKLKHVVIIGSVIIRLFDFKLFTSLCVRSELRKLRCCRTWKKKHFINSTVQQVIWKPIGYFLLCQLKPFTHTFLALWCANENSITLIPVLLDVFDPWYSLMHILSFLLIPGTMSQDTPGKTLISFTRNLVLNS